MKLIYIDESGGLKGSFNYFNISLLLLNNTKDLKKLEYSIKRFRKGKYKKKLKNVKEIKAYKSSENLIIDLLKVLNETDFKVYSIFFDNKKIINRNILKKKGVNEVYQSMIFKLLEKVDLDIQAKNEIYLDKFLPRFLEKQFRLNIEKFLDNNHSKVYCVKSEKFIGIQFVDLVSWSSFQYLEKNKQNFLKIIKNKYILFEYQK